MKYLLYKTRYIWVVILAIVLGMAFTGIAHASPQFDKFGFEIKGTCVEIATAVCNRYLRNGQEAEVWVVEFTHPNGSKNLHAICVYKKKGDDNWLVHDDSIWYIGKGWKFEDYDCYDFEYKMELSQEAT